MNPVVWAAMQSPQVLQAVDYMVPDLVDEEDLEIFDEIYRLKVERIEDLGFIANALENGGILSVVGVTLLMIPDPVVYSIGSYFGGPIGGTAAVVILNIVGFGLIYLDQII